MSILRVDLNGFFAYKSVEQAKNTFSRRYPVFDPRHGQHGNFHQIRKIKRVKIGQVCFNQLLLGAACRDEFIDLGGNITAYYVL